VPTLLDGHFLPPSSAVQSGLAEQAFRVANGQLPLCQGIGGRVATWLSSSDLACRVPLSARGRAAGLPRLDLLWCNYIIPGGGVSVRVEELDGYTRDGVVII